MSAVKEKIIGAVTVMSDSDAENFWNLIVKKYSASWDDIEEETPDDTDIQMLEAIEKDPDCHEVTRECDIDWG